MTYKIGYLYQRSADGQHWANGSGPLQENLRFASAHDSKDEAITAGARLIGSPSPMGEVVDAYLVAVRGNMHHVLGAVDRQGKLDRGYERNPIRMVR